MGRVPLAWPGPEPALFYDRSSLGWGFRLQQDRLLGADKSNPAPDDLERKSFAHARSFLEGEGEVIWTPDDPTKACELPGRAS